MGKLEREMRVELRMAWQDAVGDPRDGEPVPLDLRTIVWLIALVGVAAALVGLADDTGGFLGNAVAELSGVTLGAVLAVTLIDQVITHRRTERWKVVRKQIERAVCVQVEATVREFALHAGNVAHGDFLRTLGSRQLTARPDVSDAMDGVADALAASIPRLATAIRTDLASSRSLHESIQISFAPIPQILTTRVMVLGDEPDLVRRLMTLEHHERQWRECIARDDRLDGTDRDAWEAGLSTLRACIEAYRYFAHPS